MLKSANNHKWQNFSDEPCKCNGIAQGPCIYSHGQCISHGMYTELRIRTTTRTRIKNIITFCEI